MGTGTEKKRQYEPPSTDAQDKKEDVSPLGENIIPAFYVVYNTKEKTFGLIGAEGFLDDRVRAYGALAMAGKMLDDYYEKLDKARASIITKVRNFDAKLAFRNFTRRN